MNQKKILNSRTSNSSRSRHPGQSFDSSSQKSLTRNHICGMRDSDTQLCDTVPGTENFAGHGLGPLPTPYQQCHINFGKSKFRPLMKEQKWVKPMTRKSKYRWDKLDSKIKKKMTRRIRISTQKLTINPSVNKFRLDNQILIQQ